jgi:hypothetical protein
MRGYVSPGGLESIRVFEDKKTNKNKFAASLELRLSADNYVNYMTYEKDTAALQNNRHLVKYIYGLNWNQTTAEVYVYNDNDTLSRIMKGNYTIDSETIKGMTDAQLHIANSPSGGFPSGSTKLTSAQLASINSGTMPFEVNQETTYVYSGDTLTGRKFFGYKSEETHSDNIAVSYYNSGVLKEIKSSGVDVKYNTDGLLDKVNNYEYDYSTNGKRVTVDVLNNGQKITTYIFEEE